MGKRKNLLSFEAALDKLESLVANLEGGQLPLEEAFAEFEQGITLIKQCQTTLSQLEQKVSILLKEGENFEETPFNDNLEETDNEL